MARIPKPSPQKGGKAGIAPVPSESESDDLKNPSFRFTNCDQNKMCLRDWKPDEIDKLVAAFARMEAFTWRALKTAPSSGLRYKATPRSEVTSVAFPDSFPSDVGYLHGFRVDQRMRVYGYRVGSIFYIVWFDRDHRVFPG